MFVDEYLVLASIIEVWRNHVYKYIYMTLYDNLIVKTVN